MATQSATQHSILKRIMGTSKSLSQHGFGRTLIRVNAKYQFVSDIKARKFIKLCKKTLHPLDRFKRFSVARKLQQHSPYAEFVPKKLGYKPINLSDIPEAEKAIAACREYIKKLDQKIKPLIGRQTFIQPLHEDHPDLKGIAKAGIYNLRDISGLTELMLSPTMIKIASCYFGEVPIVASVNLYLSLPNDTMEGSQMYHTDAEDFQQLQFIFAITDIDEETGPFTADSSG